MITKVVEFDGVPLIVPIVNGVPLEFPFKTFEEFTSYCGAGKGIGDLVVPETVLFLKVSPACYVHDNMFELAAPTWYDFHASNSVFRTNIDSIIHHRSHNIVMEHLRYYRSVTYFNAVNTVGAYCFWNVKREQGYEGKLGLEIAKPELIV